MRKVKDTRKAITPEILESLCKATESICWFDFGAILFKAEFSVAFFSPLSISELVPLTKKQHRGLQILDLLLSD